MSKLSKLPKFPNFPNFSFYPKLKTKALPNGKALHYRNVTSKITFGIITLAISFLVENG